MPIVDHGTASPVEMLPGVIRRTLTDGDRMMLCEIRMNKGAVVPLHEHTALEQTFMLEGFLEDAEGRCGAGDFVWRPGGNIHVAHAPNGATFLSVFTRPNRFFDGTKFFTS